MTQEQILNILKTGANVFLTGEPGSGKTYIINEYVSYLRSHGLEPAITASTGIAATHIGGMTIHSWSGIGVKAALTKEDLDRLADNKYVSKRIRRARILIIDEVSMLDGNILDMVEAVCRKTLPSPVPFGGLQVIFVGDFFQLPPIAREAKTFQFAFQSRSWMSADPAVCYLTEQHRQDDAAFLSILSAIRANNLNDSHIKHLESRITSHPSEAGGTTKLFSHNVDVDRVNEEALAKLSGSTKTFMMSSRGFGPMIEGLKRTCLSPEKLELKAGAAVMFIKNNPSEGFVNGTLGEVTGFSGESGYPIVRTRDGRTIEAEPMEWTLEDGGIIKARIEQIPLRLAWAITIHKSQGMSLDAAVIDLSSAFEFGQGYVALSRVRRLSGLYLLGYNRQSLLVHPAILAEDKNFRIKSETQAATLRSLSEEGISQRQKDFIISRGGKMEAMAPSSSHKNKKERTNTYEITLALFKNGKNILEIAKERGLSSGTILSHTEHLFIKSKINRGEMERLLSPKLTKALPLIHAVFRELNDGKLSPVFERCGGQYSYDELRLARILME